MVVTRSKTRGKTAKKLQKRPRRLLQKKQLGYINYGQFFLEHIALQGGIFKFDAKQKIVWEWLFLYKNQSFEHETSLATSLNYFVLINVGFVVILLCIVVSMHCSIVFYFDQNSVTGSKNQ